MVKKKLIFTRFPSLQFPVLSGLVCAEWCGSMSAILCFSQHDSILHWTKLVVGTLKSGQFSSHGRLNKDLLLFLASTVHWTENARKHCTRTSSIVNAPTTNSLWTSPQDYLHFQFGSSLVMISEGETIQVLGDKIQQAEDLVSTTWSIIFPEFFFFSRDIFDWIFGCENSSIFKDFNDGSLF